MLSTVQQRCLTEKLVPVHEIIDGLTQNHMIGFIHFPWTE